MQLRTLATAVLMGVLAIPVVIPVDALAKEKQEITVSYLVGPPRPLPEGLKAVAVIDSGVSTQGVKQDDREAKWSVMAADMIEAMVQAGSTMTPTPIVVAKRSQTQAVLREHDLALAGMVAGEQATTAGKLLAVQGLITSRITIQIDEQRSKKSTVDWMSVMGGFAQETLGGRERGGGREGRGDPRWGRGRETVQPAPPPSPGRGGPVVVQPPPRTEVRTTRDGQTYTVTRQPPPAIVYRQPPSAIYASRPVGGPPGGRQERTAIGGGLTLKTKEVEEISRHLTVQCSFTLIDAVTGAAIVQYSTPPAQKRDKRSPNFLFGSMMGEKELDPVDHFIGELVEQSTREFVSLLVPVQMSAKYELVANHGASEDGLLALRADNYAGAVEAFVRNLNKYPKDDAAMFALGVVSELMSKPEDALKYYRQALSTKGVDKDDLPIYTAAKDRLTAHM
ncbi:MAG: hypothetical protein FWC56_00375, partial [Phycisphaerae bacterium]|nr:hypothetical protein [Phycisphaerae bacterium]